LVPTGPVVGESVIFVVTLNCAVKECDAASVATTGWLPKVDRGTVKLAAKEPVVLVVTVEGTVSWFAPLYLIVIVETGAYPVPDTVTLVPIAPLDGASAIFEVTLNGALAELVLASVAATVLVPVIDFGTVKLEVKEPVVLVVTAGGIVSCVTPLYVMVTDEAGAKFVPVTVTVVPTDPLVGDSVIVGTTTVNVAFAELCELSVTVTVCDPGVDVGTVNVTPLNDPVMLILLKVVT
jgi:hypothetical protein